MNRFNLSQKLYIRAMLMVSILICLTICGLWQVAHPTTSGRIESWQPVVSPPGQAEDIQIMVVTPTPTSGVAGVSVSRSGAAPLAAGAEPSQVPTALTSVPGVTVMPVVIQPIACALGPTPLPQGGAFCQSH